MIAEHAQIAEILLVEDSEADVRLCGFALEEANLVHHLHVASDGDEAIDLLLGHSEHDVMPRPDLILLDLNLPKRPGYEVLSEIKNDPDLRIIPVVVMSTSTSRDDIVRAYELGANCYIPKPSNYDEFVEVVRLIKNFWFSAVALPKYVV
ncbi:MAG: response regulator [Pirellulaceae bacterium]|nr:response regulator [Planctomycetales bacterium]MCA9209930.1 response regulator [Planctomycetales bacterium]